MTSTRSTQAGGVSLAEQFRDLAARGDPSLKSFLADLNDDDRRQLGVELAMMAANERRYQAQAAASQTTNRSSGPGPSSSGPSPISAAAAGIKLDPSRAFDVGYIKEVMGQTAKAQGNPPPTQKDYDYWIPKILAIGGKGLDEYWLGRLLTPDTGGAGGGGGGNVGGGASSSGSMEDDDIADEIRAILQAAGSDDKGASEKIKAVLKKHGRPAETTPNSGG